MLHSTSGWVSRKVWCGSLQISPQRSVAFMKFSVQWDESHYRWPLRGFAIEGRACTPIAQSGLIWKKKFRARQNILEDLPESMDHISGGLSASLVLPPHARAQQTDRDGYLGSQYGSLSHLMESPESIRRAVTAATTEVKMREEKQKSASSTRTPNNCGLISSSLSHGGL